METEEELRKQLSVFSERAAVSLVTDIGNYVSIIKGLVSYSADRGAKCVYITCTIPARVVVEQLSAESIKTDNIYFIDCISYMVGSFTEEKQQTIYIESPTMLEGVMLKVDMWLKKLKDTKKMVFLDSISTLAMHNDGALLSEFLHYFVNNLRARGIQVVILSVAEQTPPELETVLRLVCDETVILKGEEQGSDAPH
jgi:KaiC/GvpD/RAD55 family RecA-like ATPase